ncbi:MAG: helix-turn-helix transcriptional regulator [Clostridia bacterium]|nr:helix-turn-helix transcriptional regulator [Clostridia bacterium]
MGKYDELIDDSSIWLSATPTQLTTTLPFYISEVGHFIAEEGYEVIRNTHNSFLLLFTKSGMGTVISEDMPFVLEKGNAIIIDCHTPHRYFSVGEGWEFYWVHFNGAMAKDMFSILYPDNISAVNINDGVAMLEIINGLLELAGQNDISGSLKISLGIHNIFNIMVSSLLEGEQVRHNGRYYEYIQNAVDFIHKNYDKNITIDDIIDELHISKFHFIRLFKRTMGTTPYNYIMAYRINTSKMLLRSTDKPVSEIAELCGFLDSSNFIRQFKKHCNQKPTAYRHDFSL